MSFSNESDVSSEFAMVIVCIVENRYIVNVGLKYLWCTQISLWYKLKKNIMLKIISFSQGLKFDKKEKKIAPTLATKNRYKYQGHK